MKHALRPVFAPQLIRRRGSSIRLWIVAAAAAAVVAVALGVWVSRRGKKVPEFREWPVERGRIVLTVEASGVVTPQNRISLDPPLAGRIDEILVDEGDKITKGQILAWISSSDRATLLDAARAQGPEEVKKWTEVYKPTPLVAPMAGFIIARSAEPGQTVGKSGSPLVMADRLIVKAQVDETDMGKVEVGQRVRVTLDAYPGMRLPGRLDHLAYEARMVNNVTVYDIDVELLRSAAVLRSGMTATVAVIVAERQDVVVIPIEALTDREDGLAALMKGPGGKPVLTPVKIGLTSEGEVEITEGLKEGDVLLVSTRALPPRNLSNAGSPFTPGSFRQSRRGGWEPGGRRR